MDHVTTVRKLLEAWNSHDLDRIAAFFHEDFENHQAPFEPVIGRDAYLAHCAHWFTAFPDFWIKEVTLFGDGDLVCLESYGGGTRAAEFFGEPGSGAEEIVHACDVLVFRGDRIALERGYWDFSAATGKLAPVAQ